VAAAAASHHDVLPQAAAAGRPGRLNLDIGYDKAQQNYDIEVIFLSISTFHNFNIGDF
jgi:hypothetical protein